MWENTHMDPRHGLHKILKTFHGNTFHRLENPKGCYHHPHVGDRGLRPREVAGACPSSRGQ